MSHDPMSKAELREHVHPLQVIADEIEMRPHHVPVGWIVTSRGRLRCASRYPRPSGIHWEFLAEEKIASIPVLRSLRGRPA